MNESKPSTFSELVRQFLARIHDRVFTQDMAGVILKIAVGEKSGVYADRYLDEMRAGTWTEWNTPRKCMSLDGKDRKLMLYDPTRKAITVVVGIKSVTENDSEPDYSWTNKFAEGTLRILKCPINLSENELVFDGFNKGQSPFRNITHEQYRKLMGQRFDTESG